MKKATYLFLSLLLAVLALSLAAKSIFAQGLGAGPTPASLQDFETVFAGLLGAIIPAAGIIFFIMFIVGGFKYMTAAGDPALVSSAHKTLTYAIGGLVVAALAFTILVVIETVTGAPVTQFSIIGS